jgi:hypothetical protein
MNSDFQFSSEVKRPFMKPGSVWKVTNGINFKEQECEALD